MNSVHRMKLDNDTGEPMGGTEEWFKLPSMIQERSDHACAVAQFKWEYGIIVAGTLVFLINVLHVYLIVGSFSIHHALIRNITFIDF